MPEGLEGTGVWPKRVISNRSADYATPGPQALGDPVRIWAIFNEPGAAPSWDTVHVSTLPDAPSSLRRCAPRYPGI
ncbi:hypothetical protein [Streptomyces sp. NPDC059215]|uniref:hypothetical protein n=1 Tax=Streptomyces sp. NPDC059215 TaxID=3346772 RepID=UPI003680412D